MRDELRQLEGDRVIVQGTVSHIQQRPEGHYDVCIADVAIRRWDPEVPTLSVTPISVDHLWVVKPPQIFDKGKPIIYLGDVHFYARQNGSVDLGVKSIPSICLNRSFLELLDETPKCRDKRAGYVGSYFASMVEEVMAGRAYLISDSESEMDFLRNGARAAIRLLRERQLNESARLSSTLARIQRSNASTKQTCIPFL